MGWDDEWGTAILTSKPYRYARLGENAGYGIDKMLMWEQKRGKVDFTDDVVSSTIIFYFERDDIRFSINDTQGDTQDDTQGDTQDDTQGDTQGIDAIIIQAIRKNPQITTEELAQIANKSIATIKRHIAKLSDVRYVGSGYSGHWEIIPTDWQPTEEQKMIGREIGAGKLL